jgi:hypothetical protein
MTPIITGAIFVGIALHGGWLQGATTADLIGLLADGFQRAVREHDDVSAELDVNHPEILKHLTEAPASRNRLKRSLRLEERARMRVNKLGAQSTPAVCLDLNVEVLTLTRERVRRPPAPSIATRIAA